MIRVSQKELEAVFRLDGQKRFERFVKLVADTEEAWGLWKDGWALLEDDSGNQVFPLWPAREYAQACAADDWASYEPSSIALSDLLEELLPTLRDKGVLTGVFPTPKGKGVTPELVELESAIRTELKKYE